MPRTGLLACALVLACSGDDKPLPCLATRDCAAGQACVDGFCGPPSAQACLADPDCGAGRMCFDGLCAGGTACSKNPDCPAGQRCDTVLGECLPVHCDQAGACPNGGFCDFRTNRCGPRRACTNDAQCGPPNGTCDGGFCTNGCGRAGCGAGRTCVASTGRCTTGGGPVDDCTTTGCGAGFRCDSISGECVPDGGGGGCTSDAQCGAPAMICEVGQCIAGCTPGGCPAPLSCHTATGRCVGGGSGGCTSDEQCGAPAAICIDGLCSPGCGQSGCPSYQVCAGTGRCEFKACLTDAECGPPSGRCEGGVCIAGCGIEGCAFGVCNQADGRCDDGIEDVPCTTNLECSTKRCITPEPQDGVTPGVCGHQCGGTSDCAPGLRCEPVPGANGIKACLSGDALGGMMIGTLKDGQRCEGPDGSISGRWCQSGICIGDTEKCADRCSLHAHCRPGSSCRAIAEDAWEGTFIQACVPDVLASLAVYDYPEYCDAFCRSQFCNNPGAGPYCFTPCCSSNDCGPGSICVPQLPVYTYLYAELYSATLMNGCMPALGPGTDPVGSPAALEDALNCRSNHSTDLYLDGSRGTPYCTDLCCLDRDCPEGFVCGASFDPQSGYTFPMCLKAP